MITVGYATVDEYSGGPLFIGAHHDRFISGLQRLAETIKNNGSKALVQINHAGRYALSRHIDKKQPVAPSAIKSTLTRETPRALSFDEIAKIIERFAHAARRIQAAGFDGLEVMHGTGYLVGQFLSPITNQRTDAYGGSLENRMRFGLEMVKAIRTEIGDKFPLVVRTCGNDFMPGGNARQELQAYARALVAAGVDALNINVGWHEARVPQIITAVPRGAFAYLARDVKATVDVPVMAGHRINDIDKASELIADGFCDMVCMGRALIADPSLPSKALAGQSERIVHCTACAQGCFDHVFSEKPVECLCNPKAGYENECRNYKTFHPLRVMVVGGGAAGMSAALSANECGHKVTLYEKENRLGGQLFLAGSPPGRNEFIVLAHDLAKQVTLAGIQLILNKAVQATLIEAESPDAIILATGAAPLLPKIPGVGKPHVVQAWDVLLNKVTTGKRIVIIGAGAVGVETAIFLADKGTLSDDALKFLLINRAEEPEILFDLATRGTKRIVLLEMLDTIGADIGRTTRWTMLQDISRSGITVHKKTRALEITNTGVKVERDGRETEIKCDTVVLATGAAPYNPLANMLEKRGIPYRVVGDASKIGLAFDAIHMGFWAGKNLNYEFAIDTCKKNF